MEKYIFMAGLMIASALIVPELLNTTLDKNEVKSEQTQQLAVSESEPETKRRANNPLDGRRTIIEMDSRGHFIADARMNGYRSEVLVDTGATYVAINETTARKLGIHLKESDFKYKVRTANGTTMAASAVIDEIQIGRVSVKDVRASVSRDESLSVVLLGMAFLKKLRKFEIANNELILTQ
ncbi:MAG: TIGR02281 family clan AA aspartic protease [Salaquimonas sp.]